MKIRHLFYIGTLIVAAFPTFAQDSTAAQSLSVNFGIGSVYNKDHFQSPYTFKGNNATVGIGYSNLSKRKHRHEVELMATSGQLASEISPKAGSQLGTLTYNYFFRPKSFTSKLYGMFGVGMHAVATNVDYLPDVQESKAYLSAGAFLAITGRVAYALSKRSDISLTVGGSTLGIVHRPTFEIEGESITAVVGPGDGFLFDAKLLYSYKLNRNIDLTIAYQNNYFSCSKTNPIYLSQNLLTLGIRKIIATKTPRH